MKKALLLYLFILCTFSNAYAETGVTDSEILIGQWGPLTGPGAIWGAVALGTQCYFDMINADGGICGRKIVYYLRDDGYIPSRTKEIAKDLVEKKQVFAIAGGVGTATGIAVKEYLDHKKIPWVAPGSGSTHWAYPPARYLFSIYPLYCDEAALLTNYAIKHLYKKRIVIFYQNDDYGKTALYGAHIALRSHGISFVNEVNIDPMESDITYYYKQIENAKPDCIIMAVNPKHAALILKKANDNGLKSQWMCLSPLAEFPVMYRITKGLFKGVISTNFSQFLYYPEDNKDQWSLLMKKYKAAHENYAPNERWGILFIGGFHAGELIAEGLKLCKRDLTRENFIRAMESLKNFQGIGSPITFSPNQRLGTRSMFLIKCGEDGKTERISDWETIDIDVQEVIKHLHGKDQ